MIKINNIFKPKANRNFLLAFGFWFLAINFKAQTNYVINGGFEYIQNCGGTYGGTMEFTIPWDTLVNGGGGGYPISRCYNPSSYWGVPYNLLGGGYQEPHTGNGYAYLIFLKLTPNPAVNWRNYIQQKMTHKLISGKSYCVTYWASLVNYVNYGVDELGAYFDDGSIQSLGFLKEAIANPQVKSPSGVFYMDTLNWMKVQGSFVANGTEEYITLGNFRYTAATTFTALDGNTTAGLCNYFIDDVSVIETDLPAFVGADTYVIPGDSVYIGRPSEIGLNDDCFWYKLPNTTTPIDTVAGLWVKPIITTTYVVKQDICGTVKWDTVVVHQSAVGLNELKIKDYGLKLYPNPTASELNIEIQELKIKDYKLKIYDAIGRLISEKEITFKNNTTTIDTKDLANGVYVLNLKSTNSQTVSKRFVVAR